MSTEVQNGTVIRYSARVDGTRMVFKVKQLASAWIDQGRIEVVCKGHQWVENEAGEQITERQLNTRYLGETLVAWIESGKVTLTQE